MKQVGNVEVPQEAFLSVFKERLINYERDHTGATNRVAD